jgi:mono/diheme cytochrome c family protein
MMTSIHLPLALFTAACCVMLGPGLARSTGGEPPGQQTGVSNLPSMTDAEESEAKSIFAAQCSWCHGNYGMTADKGPKLAGTKMTEREVEGRIRDGKPGSMPSFRRFLDEPQIKLMAEYIKSLQP